MSCQQLEQKGQFNGTEELTEDEMEMLMDLEDEYSRRGNFKRIYPLEGNINTYEQFFEENRYQNSNLRLMQSLVHKILA